MNGMKKCVIVVNAYSRLQSSLNQSQRLRQEFADMGVQADIYPADALGCAVEEDGCWRLTPRGFLVSNQIIGGMLDALAADKQRRAEAAARGDYRVC